MIRGRDLDLSCSHASLAWPYNVRIIAHTSARTRIDLFLFEFEQRQTCATSGSSVR